jgi:hypothetical protein
VLPNHFLYPSRNVPGFLIISCIRADKKNFLKRFLNILISNLILKKYFGPYLADLSENIGVSVHYRTVHILVVKKI